MDSFVLTTNQIILFIGNICIQKDRNPDRAGDVKLDSTRSCADQHLISSNVLELYTIGMT